MQPRKAKRQSFLSLVADTSELYDSIIAVTTDDNLVNGTNWKNFALSVVIVQRSH